jgi:hypothetical protein
MNHGHEQMAFVNAASSGLQSMQNMAHQTSSVGINHNGIQMPPPNLMYSWMKPTGPTKTSKLNFL